MLGGLRDRVQSELHELAVDGAKLVLALGKPETVADFHAGYQRWYTRAKVAVRQLAPDRLDEFEDLYRPKKEPAQLSFTNYGIYYYLIGVSWGGNTKPAQTTAGRVLQQLRIIESIETRVDSVIGRIHELLQADLFDSEMGAARELLRRGHVRAAGSVGGVLLEQHLRSVTEQKGLTSGKRNPGISDFNDALRDGRVIDQPAWRRIQFLADVRNICAHSKGSEPTAEQVKDLLDGTEWVIATIGT